MATAEKAREIAQHALGLNSKQQDALRTRLSALEERLAAIDKLIVGGWLSIYITIG